MTTRRPEFDALMRSMESRDYSIEEYNALRNVAVPFLTSGDVERDRSEDRRAAFHRKLRIRERWIIGAIAVAVILLIALLAYWLWF